MDRVKTSGKRQLVPGSSAYVVAVLISLVHGTLVRRFLQEDSISPWCLYILYLLQDTSLNSIHYGGNGDHSTAKDASHLQQIKTDGGLLSMFRA